MPQRSDKYGYRKSQAVAVGIFRECVGEKARLDLRPISRADVALVDSRFT